MNLENIQKAPDIVLLGVYLWALTFQLPMTELLSEKNLDLGYDGNTTNISQWLIDQRHEMQTLWNKKY